MRTVYQKCKISVRRILKQSKNAEINKLFSVTTTDNIRSDSLVNQIITSNQNLDPKQLACKTDQLFQTQVSKSNWKDFFGLKEQNIILKHILFVCQSKTISQWQSVVTRLPNNIVCFVRKALIFCLPYKSNLFR